MRMEDVKEMLMMQAEAMMKLADKLGEGGEPLTSADKQLVRVALMPAVKECGDLIGSAFMLGNEQWLEDNMKRLNGYMDIAM